MRAEMNLTRNELAMYSQGYYKADQEITAHTHQRIILGTSSGQQQFDLTSVTTGAALMVNTDRTITIAIDTAANTITMSDNGMFMFTGAFTHVYVENNSTTYVASVELIATD
jgi:allophanate hydrolase subunit 2